jgi:two-component system, NtrC family, response regulator GlrR
LRQNDTSETRILVLGDPSPEGDRLFDDLSAVRRFSCQRASCRGFTPAMLADAACDVAVFVATSPAAHVEAALEVLSSYHRARPATLGIVAAPCDEAARKTFDRTAAVLDDFVVWPAEALVVGERIRRLVGPSPVGLAAVHERLLSEMTQAQLVGRDPAFVPVVEKIPRLARAGWPVLITGETGTGKEVCARAIHHCGPRRAAAFIAADCAAFPEQLFENELFGHARGAFTDAHRDQKGLAALAEGGTLFLDEVDSLSLPAQAKLLRFLQERSYRPLGSERFVRADVAVIAASNRTLESLVDRRQFRPDLFFRLNVLRLHVPALRDRPSDIELLARRFVDDVCAESGLPPKSLSVGAIRVLTSHNWPGNVRELLNVVQRGVLLSEGHHILARHVSPAAEAETPSAAGTPTFRQARTQMLAAFERDYVEMLLRTHAGNVTRAARAAAKDRRAFGRLIKKHGIRRTEA